MVCYYPLISLINADISLKICVNQRNLRTKSAD
jgi:hypothetical protein